MKIGYKFTPEQREHLRLGHLGRYGISIDEFESLWNRQNGVCAICGISLKEIKYRIDHDHNTGKVRGLLCISCNTGVGLLKDSPGILASAARYLTNGKNG